MKLLCMLGAHRWIPIHGRRYFMGGTTVYTIGCECTRCGKKRMFE